MNKVICKVCRQELEKDGRCRCTRASSSLQPAGSAALVQEQNAANELYQAACCLMRYKESAQWHNLENAAQRFNAARQSRINDEIMRQNGRDQRPGTQDA